MNRRARVTAVVLALLVSSPASAEAPAPASAPAKATLQDVAFLSGHWVDASEKHLSEEVWTAPSGDSMIGMWRLVADGKVRLFELLSLKQEGEGVVLRIRHFDPSFVSREEKTTPVALPLVERRERFARFTGPAVGSPGEVTLAYQREGETLTGTLTKGEKSQEFRFRLRK